MKRKLLRTTGITLFVLLLVMGGLIAYIKFVLPDIPPATALKVKSTPALVQRGKYLANHVTVCIDCHSTRDFSKFAGPPMPGTWGSGGDKFDQEFGFPGVFYAKNITPYNMSNWTDGEIFRVITTGVTQKGEAIFPVMPYHSYGRMHNEDVYAIIAYLRTLPSIKKDVPPSVPDFPMNIIINTIPSKADPFPAIKKTDTLAYGKYITTIAGCTECHTKKVNGKVAGEDFAGGFEFNMPGGSVLRSTNITPDKNSGIGNWTADYFIQRFKAYADSSSRNKSVAKGDFNTVMPWIMYSEMDSTDLRAIYTYLRSLKPVNNIVERYSSN